jgi:hypothetical protein
MQWALLRLSWLQADARKEYLCQLRADLTIDGTPNPQSAGYWDRPVSYNLASLRSARNCFIWTAAGKTQGSALPYLGKPDVAKFRRLLVSLSASLQSPFGPVPPEEGIVVEQAMESTVNNECLTSDDGLHM